MKISDLQEMESIVSKSSFLGWEGWNVIFLQEDDSFSLKNDAAFVNSKWHKKLVFKNHNGSWDIPDSILRKGDVQVR